MSRALPLVAGYATRRGTDAYAARFGGHCGAGHFSDFLNLHLKLSSLGLGTFPGAAAEEVDADYAANVERALAGGINVIDTAAHYRYGRSLVALRVGLERAFDVGVEREQLFVVAKGGFLLYPEGPPADPAAWFDANIAARGLGTRADLAGHHLISPAYLSWQLEFARAALGLETLDAFLVDQPEVQVAALGKEQGQRKLARCFAVLEQAVKQNKLRGYGVSSFESLRAATDAPLFQSIAALLGLAEDAAKLVWKDPQARHHLRVVQLPFNPAMTEGFTRFSQATGQGNVASTLQAAHQLRVYVMSSHALGKGRFAHDDPLAAALPALANPAQRALQFARSTPGIGTALAGVSTPAHLEDLLAVARVSPMPREEYLRLYRRAE
ncbi:MAG TPA: aldo/keto reductase [Burkholderiales bacterium]|nr:aldo/keto reductase [Burkholderiales bacterium]